MRLFGGLLILCAFVLTGISVVSLQKARIDQLQAIAELLRSLSRRLQWGREPLREVFADQSDPLLERVGFLPILRENGKAGYPSAWEAALQTLFLPTDALPPLRLFGSNLGKLPLAAQQEQISLCLSSVEEVLQAERAKAAQKKHSTVSLWALAGLLLAVLLL